MLTIFSKIILSLLVLFLFQIHRWIEILIDETFLSDWFDGEDVVAWLGVCVFACIVIGVILFIWDINVITV